MSCITATNLAGCIPRKHTVNFKTSRKFQGHVSQQCQRSETKQIRLVENYNLQNYLSYGTF